MGSVVIVGQLFKVSTESAKIPPQEIALKISRHNKGNQILSVLKTLLYLSSSKL